MPPAATAGEPVTISYTVSNHSTQPAIGSWSDSVYISPDPTFDTNAQLIGTFNVGSLGGPLDLAEGQGYTGSVTATLPVELPGTYYILVYTNVFNNIYEGTNYANNVATAPNQLTVTVPILTLGVPLDDTISGGQSKLYAVQVPAGQTMEVNLTSSDQGGATELYVKFQGLPSSLNYDAAYQGYPAANQSATVPSDRAGRLLRPGPRRQRRERHADRAECGVAAVPGHRHLARYGRQCAICDGHRHRRRLQPSGDLEAGAAAVRRSSRR